FEALMMRVLAKNSKEITLYNLADQLNIITKLIQLQISPEEYQSLILASPTKPIQTITAELNEFILELKSDQNKALFYEEDLEVLVEKSLQFYALTHKRDQAFLQAMNQKLEQEGLNKGVLIAGGYHATHLKALFKQNNISFISITPQVLHTTNYPRYEKMLLAQLVPNVKDEQGIMNANNAMSLKPVKAGGELTTSRLARALNPNSINKVIESIASSSRMSQRPEFEKKDLAGLFDEVHALLDNSSRSQGQLNAAFDLISKSGPHKLGVAMQDSLKAFHSDDIEKLLRPAKGELDKKVEILDIIYGLALFVMDRNRKEKLLSQDEVEGLNTIITKYNAHPTTKNVLSLPSLFAGALKPYYSNNNTFVKYSHTLKTLPGEYKYRAVAYSLYLHAVHMSSTLRDTEHDYLIVEKNLQFLFQAINSPKIEISPDTLSMMRAGIIRISIYMSHYLSEFKLLKSGPFRGISGKRELMILNQLHNNLGFLNRIQELLRNNMDFIRLGYEHYYPKGGDEDELLLGWATIFMRNGILSYESYLFNNYHKKNGTYNTPLDEQLLLVGGDALLALDVKDVEYEVIIEQFEDSRANIADIIKQKGRDAMNFYIYAWTYFESRESNAREHFEEWLEQPTWADFSAVRMADGDDIYDFDPVVKWIVDPGRRKLIVGLELVLVGLPLIGGIVWLWSYLNKPSIEELLQKGVVLGEMKDVPTQYQAISKEEKEKLVTSLNQNQKINLLAALSSNRFGSRSLEAWEAQISEWIAPLNWQADKGLLNTFILDEHLMANHTAEDYILFTTLMHFRKVLGSLQGSETINPTYGQNILEVVGQATLRHYSSLDTSEYKSRGLGLIAIPLLGRLASEVGSRLKNPTLRDKAFKYIVDIKEYLPKKDSYSRMAREAEIGPRDSGGRGFGTPAEFGRYVKEFLGKDEATIMDLGSGTDTEFKSKPDVTIAFADILRPFIEVNQAYALDSAFGLTRLNFVDDHWQKISEQRPRQDRITSPWVIDIPAEYSNLVDGMDVIILKQPFLKRIDFYLNEAHALLKAKGIIMIQLSQDDFPTYRDKAQREMITSLKRRGYIVEVIEDSRSFEAMGFDQLTPITIAYLSSTRMTKKKAQDELTLEQLHANGLRAAAATPALELVKFFEFSGASHKVSSQTLDDGAYVVRVQIHADDTPFGLADVLSRELAGVSQYDLIYNASHQLIAIIPVLSRKANAKNKYFYFDFSNYYAPNHLLNQFGPKKRRSWKRLLNSSDANREIIQDYIDDTVSIQFQIKRKWNKDSQVPFVYAQIHKTTGRIDLVPFYPKDLLNTNLHTDLRDLLSLVFEESDEHEQIIIPVFPTVYSPAYYSAEPGNLDNFVYQTTETGLQTKDLDHNAWRTFRSKPEVGISFVPRDGVNLVSHVFNSIRKQQLGPGDHLIDDTTGSGYWLWMMWLASGKRDDLNYEARDINPLAIANAKALASIAGMPASIYQQDGSKINSSNNKYRVIVANGPSYIDSDVQYFLEEFHDQTSFYLEYTSQLEDRLAVNGQAYLWHTSDGRWDDYSDDKLYISLIELGLDVELSYQNRVQNYYNNYIYTVRHKSATSQQSHIIKPSRMTQANLLSELDLAHGGATEDMPVWYLLDELRLNTAEVVEVEPDPENNIHIVRIRIPSPDHEIPEMQTGPALLKVLLNANNQYDLLFNEHKHLVAILPSDLTPAQKYPFHSKYLDLSPYYLESSTNKHVLDDLENWDAFNDQVSSDNSDIVSYRNHILKYVANDVAPMDATPYYLAELEKSTGDLRLRAFNISSYSRVIQESPPNPDFHQVILPVFPLVYPAAYTAYFDLDSRYHEEIYTDKSIKPNQHILIGGPGSGLDAWIASLRLDPGQGGQLSAFYKSTLEGANVRATAKWAGFNINAIQHDNIVNASGEVIALERKVDHLLWNMPSYTHLSEKDSNRDRPFVQIWDADYKGQQLRRLAKGLNDVLTTSGQAHLWNMPPSEKEKALPDYYLLPAQDMLEVILATRGSYDPNSEDPSYHQQFHNFRPQWDVSSHKFQDSTDAWVGSYHIRRLDQTRIAPQTEPQTVRMAEGEAEKVGLSGESLPRGVLKRVLRFVGLEADEVAGIEVIDRGATSQLTIESINVAHRVRSITITDHEGGEKVVILKNPIRRNLADSWIPHPIDWIINLSHTLEIYKNEFKALGAANLLDATAPWSQIYFHRLWPYLLMNSAEGDALSRKSLPSEEVARDFFELFGKKLKKMHEHGITHNDLTIKKEAGMVLNGRHIFWTLKPAVDKDSKERLQIQLVDYNLAGISFPKDETERIVAAIREELNFEKRYKINRKEAETLFLKGYFKSRLAAGEAQGDSRSKKYASRMADSKSKKLVDADDIFADIADGGVERARDVVRILRDKVKLDKRLSRPLMKNTLLSIGSVKINIGKVLGRRGYPVRVLRDRATLSRFIVLQDELNLDNYIVFEKISPKLVRVLGESKRDLEAEKSFQSFTLRQFDAGAKFLNNMPLHPAKAIEATYPVAQRRYTKSIEFLDGQTIGMTNFDLEGKLFWLSAMRSTIGDREVGGGVWPIILFDLEEFKNKYTESELDFEILNQSEDTLLLPTLDQWDQPYIARINQGELNYFVKLGQVSDESGQIFLVYHKVALEDRITSIQISNNREYFTVEGFKIDGHDVMLESGSANLSLILYLVSLNEIDGIGVLPTGVSQRIDVDPKLHRIRAESLDEIATIGRAKVPLVLSRPDGSNIWYLSDFRNMGWINPGDPLEQPNTALNRLGPVRTDFVEALMDAPLQEISVGSEAPSNVDRDMHLLHASAMHSKPSGAIAYFSNNVKKILGVDIFVQKKGMEQFVSARLPIEILALGIDFYDWITFRVEGPVSKDDLNKVLDMLQDLIDDPSNMEAFQTADYDKKYIQPLQEMANSNDNQSSRDDSVDGGSRLAKIEAVDSLLALESNRADYESRAIFVLGLWEVFRDRFDGGHALALRAGLVFPTVALGDDGEDVLHLGGFSIRKSVAEDIRQKYRHDQKTLRAKFVEGSALTNRMQRQRAERDYMRDLEWVDPSGQKRLLDREVYVHPDLLEQITDIDVMELQLRNLVLSLKVIRKIAPTTTFYLGEVQGQQRYELLSIIEKYGANSFILLEEPKGRYIVTLSPPDTAKGVGSHIDIPAINENELAEWSEPIYQGLLESIGLTNPDIQKLIFSPTYNVFIMDRLLNRRNGYISQKIANRVQYINLLSNIAKAEKRIIHQWPIIQAIPMQFILQVLKRTIQQTTQST
ncbi:MAG: hypothetical protein ACI9Y8_001651, partial [Candidatus Omnitrophota bacterium]